MIDPGTQQAATAAAMAVELGGKTWLVSAPTPAMELMIRAEFKRQCALSMRSPIQAIAADLKDLPAAFAKVALEAAVAQQAASGGNVEPSDAAIAERSFTREGAAFRFWAQARANHPELTREAAAALVTDENFPEVLAILIEVCQPKKSDGQDFRIRWRSYLSLCWSTDWAAIFRKALAGGRTIGDVAGATVGQWLTLLTASSGTTTTHTSMESFVRWRNVQRAKKGLPLLPIPEKKKPAPKPKPKPPQAKRKK